MTSIGGPYIDPSSFNEARWRRVGATDRQVKRLLGEYANMSIEERVAENARIASKSDDELAAEAAHPSMNPEPASAVNEDNAVSGVKTAPADEVLPSDSATTSKR